LHAGTKILKAKLKLGNNHLTLAGPGWAADSTAFCVAQRLHPHADAPQESRQTSPIRGSPREHSLPLCERFLNAAQHLTSHLTEEEYEQVAWQKTHTFVGVSAGDSLLLDKKRGPHVDVIYCDHGVPCVGYRLSLVKDNLNPEYANFRGREIGTL